MLERWAYTSHFKRLVSHKKNFSGLRSIFKWFSLNGLKDIHCWPSLYHKEKLRLSWDQQMATRCLWREFLCERSLLNIRQISLFSERFKPGKISTHFNSNFICSLFQQKTRLQSRPQKWSAYYRISEAAFLSSVVQASLV